MTESGKRIKLVTLALVVFTLIKLLLAGGKLGLGYWFGSVAVMGDGVHDLTDVGSSAMIGLSIYLLIQPANRKHPFGKARIEYIATSVIGVIILYAGFSVLAEAIGRIFTPRDLIVEPVLLAVLIFSLIIQAGLMFFFRYMKKRTASEMISALDADAYSDLLLTATVLISIFVEYMTDFKIDAYIGTAVAFVLIGTGFKILYRGIEKILGKRISRQEEREMIGHINEFEGIYGVHDLIVHDYGPGCRFLTCHVEVDSRSSFLEAHRLADRIERSLRENFGAQAVIHVDPRNVADPEAAVVENEIRRLISQLNPAWNVHGFYGTQEDGIWNLQFEVSLEDDTNQSDEEIYKQIMGLIKKHYPNYRVSIIIDRHYVMSTLPGD